MTEARFIAINYTFVLILVGIIQVFVQTFSKKGYTLGVSVPKDVTETETMKQILIDYKIMALTMTIFLGLGQYFLSYVTKSVGFLTLFFFISLGLLSLPLIIYNKNLKNMTKGLSQDKRKIIVIDNNEGKADLRKIMAIFYGASLLLIILVSLFLFINYDKIGNQIIMQTDFEGKVTRMGDKTYLNVFYPSLISLASLAMFYYINLMVIKVRPRISKENPEKSLANNRKAKKIWTYYIGINAFVMTLLFEVGVNFLALKNTNLPLYILTIITIILSIGGVIYLGIKVGTDGSRLDKMEDFSFEEDDKYWILGAGFYNNPDDPAIFVPKRIGVGYTINIGRPAGKVIMILTALIIIFSIVSMFIFN
ncbi:hypothetical protein HMPREF0072_1535 [Anaerococcus lactolyticus ATCC 51172]|uniref:DUF5808 domain-containing protein n=1 Tax=Anaerococcus lactolyticus ATCC 51172 TaxID=525254 RepID=C2BGR5_9FIRM|nr:DUF5808 domain-containing protein [Anaerococcus lactolyticus]EEI85911.1 hypothetical protein HMPREF0072_1535 [Anaerococcus lactolyticus ATCC 51172]